MTRFPTPMFRFLGLAFLALLSWSPAPAQAQWQRCASQDEVCRFRGEALVRYGAQGRYEYRVADTNAPRNPLDRRGTLWFPDALDVSAMHDAAQSLLGLHDWTSFCKSREGATGIRTLQEFSYPWFPGATLVMCSDGIGTHWRLEDYPGLLGRDPALVAGMLYRDHVRGRDDATVLVARQAPGER